MKKIYLGTFITLIITFFISSSCGNIKNIPQSQSRKDLDLSSIDSTEKPSNNFYNYANGKWLQKTIIPKNQTSWGNFQGIFKVNSHNKKALLDACLAVELPKKGSNIQLVKDLYKSAIDSLKINKLGIKPLQKELDAISTLRTSDDIMHFIISEHKKGNELLFSFHVAPDAKNQTIERAQFNQGGLGLPKKSYYFKSNKENKETIRAYKKYVATLLNLSIGDKNAQFDAESIFKLEKKLADASENQFKLRNPQINYHLLTVKSMQENAPNFKWKNTLSTLGIKASKLLIGQPEFYATASKLLTSIPIAIWKKYLTFHLVNYYAQWLSNDYETAHFNFYKKKLNHQNKQELRWKRAYSLINENLGDAFGQLYVKEFFSSEAKKQVLKLVHHLQTAFAIKIKKVDWLSDKTKEKALEKLNNISFKIGYPDHWKDYASVTVSSRKLIQNIKHLGAWQYNRNINKLHNPVDKTEWGFTPQTVNAYYNPTSNEIIFPAAILQPPFYSKEADDALNYGAIGAIIGHELTHGFDSFGSRYDGKGNLDDWWTNEDRENYSKIKQKVLNYYNNFMIQDSIHLNANLTLNENIADINGLSIAHAAFEMTPEAQKDTLIDGLTPEQRFFISYAQIWRNKTRVKQLFINNSVNPHAPEIFRVNGPLSNLKAFYKAYNVKAGDNMYQPDSTRIVIW